MLAFYRQQRLDFYFAFYLAEYLAVTLVYAYLAPQARGMLNVVSYLFFAAFAGVIVWKVLQVMLGYRIL
ncbi:MAG: hypothetical protein HY686_00775 [Chloroflexi bacterium]|nr:hypothetical protein [Chloroflexota bacterium]